MANWTMREGRTTFLYDEKSPYEKSGRGETGALRLDMKADKLMCHECGKWVGRLDTHIHHQHKLSAREYKVKHHLPIKTSLWNEALRVSVATKAANRWAAKPAREREKHIQQLAVVRHNQPKNRLCTHSTNKHGHCRAQIVERVRALADRLGRTPSWREIRETYRYSRDLVTARFGSVAGLQKASGLVPNKQHDCSGFRERYSMEMLVHMLQVFASVHSRVPLSSDCERGYLPHRATFHRRFGSWTRALSLAGLKPGTASVAA